MTDDYLRDQVPAIDNTFDSKIDTSETSEMLRREAKKFFNELMKINTNEDVTAEKRKHSSTNDGSLEKNVIQWNCQSIYSKKDELLEVIKNEHFLVLATQETMLKNKILSAYHTISQFKRKAGSIEDNTEEWPFSFIRLSQHIQKLT